MQCPSGKGRLIIVGCGLHPGHVTLETESHIKNADRVLVVCPNPLSIQHIKKLNSAIENLGRYYTSENSRLTTYRLMAKRMVKLVKQGLNVCTVFYGHPGIFVLATHKAKDALDKQGYEARMLPGISADACLFADLNVDPSTSGCQSYEATQFLLAERNIDVDAALILWQIGLVGETTLKKQAPGQFGLEAITRLLLQSYSPEHRLCIYEAPSLPGFSPRTDWLSLKDLPDCSLSSISTLYIPAVSQPTIVSERLDWLGINETEITAWNEPIDREVLI